MLQKEKVTSKDVLLYVPNLLDYGRVIALGLAWIFHNYKCVDLMLPSYFLSFALDGLDGIAARRLNQCSKFGMFLDMIVDRIGTLFFVMLLVYSNHPIAQLLILWSLIDVASHWCATLVAAMGGEHHKLKKYRFEIMHVYYENKLWALTFFCVSAELYLIQLYATNTDTNAFLTRLWNMLNIGGVLHLILGIGFWGKGVIHILQFISSCLDIVDMDLKEKNS